MSLKMQSFTLSWTSSHEISEMSTVIMMKGFIRIFLSRRIAARGYRIRLCWLTVAGNLKENL